MKKYINIIILIIWMLIIFIMSNSSGIESSSQSGLITSFINDIFRIDNMQVLQIIIRKLAHLLEYIILGILMINFLKDYKIKKYVFFSIVLCFLYACTDEIHQIFVLDRNGNVIDVMLDTVGSIIGVMSYKILKYKKQNKINKKREN